MKKMCHLSIPLKRFPAPTAQQQNVREQESPSRNNFNGWWLETGKSQPLSPGPACDALSSNINMENIKKLRNFDSHCSEWDIYHCLCTRSQHKVTHWATCTLPQWAPKQTLQVVSPCRGITAFDKDSSVQAFRETNLITVSPLKIL